MESNKKSKIAIKDGNIFTGNEFLKGTVLIKGNKIKKVIFSTPREKELTGYKIIDATDCFVSYGFFDPHVHFRTPGDEHKEDWTTGSRAALKGGFTYVIDMPNNKPSITNLNLLMEKDKIAKNSSIINYGLHIGLTDKNARTIKKIYKKAKKSKINVFGIKAFLGSSFGELLIKDIKSIKKSLKSKIITLFHAEDEEELKKYESIKYNTVYDHNKKRPAIVATKAIIKIARSCKKFKRHANIYICHVSTSREVRLIERLKKAGYRIITEVTPHHLFFSLDNIKPSNIYKVNPPIREKEDREFLIDIFNNSFFDILGTDHAPHLLKEKESDNPPSGMPGIETAFYVLYKLYENGDISLPIIFKLLTSGYQIFKLKKRGKIISGNIADITIIKKEKFTFNLENGESKADFSPYEGLTVNAKVDTVIINGKILLENGKILV